MSEFNVFAKGYNDILDQSVKISGENAGYFAEYKARYIAAYLGPDFQGRILDYGCGVGNLAVYLKDVLPKAQVDGYDTSEESLKQVPPELLKQGLYTSDPSRLRTDYDAIVLANVVHHVELPQRKDFLRQTKNNLAVGGCLIIIEHNPLNPMSQWVVRTCPFDKGVIMVNRKRMLNTLRALGYQIKRSDFLVFFPKFLSWLRPMEPYLCHLPAGAQYSVVACKEANNT